MPIDQLDRKCLDDSLVLPWWVAFPEAKLQVKHDRLPRPTLCVRNSSASPSPPAPPFLNFISLFHAQPRDAIDAGQVKWVHALRCVRRHFVVEAPHEVFSEHSDGS